MTYTSQGLMSPADLADHRALTDTGPNPECPGHQQMGSLFDVIYCSVNEECTANDECGDE